MLLTIFSMPQYRYTTAQSCVRCRMAFIESAGACLWGRLALWRRHAYFHGAHAASRDRWPALCGIMRCFRQRLSCLDAKSAAARRLALFAHSGLCGMRKARRYCGESAGFQARRKLLKRCCIAERWSQTAARFFTKGAPWRFKSILGSSFSPKGYAAAVLRHEQPGVFGAKGLKQMARRTPCMPFLLLALAAVAAFGIYATRRY